MSTPEQNSEPSSGGEKPGLQPWYTKDDIQKMIDRISELESKELRADRMIVDLEHDKDVLKAKIRELEKYNKYQADKWKELEADRDTFCYGLIQYLTNGTHAYRELLEEYKRTLK